MAKIGLPNGSGKRLKSGKSQGILNWILSGNHDLSRWTSPRVTHVVATVLTLRHPPAERDWPRQVSVSRWIR